VTGGLERKPGGASLVQQSTAPAPAAVPGKRTLTEQVTFTASAQPAATTYTVQSGDSLPAIAAKLHTTVEALKAANAGKLRSFPTPSGGTVQGFNAGDVLTVPAAAPAAPTPAPAAPAPAPPAAAPAAPAPAAPAPGTPGAAPLGDLGDAERGQQLSTFHPDELGTIDRFGMSATGRDAAKQRGEWLSASDISAAGAGKSGDAFVASVDALVGKTNFSDDQDKVIASARDFASAPQPLTPEQEATAVIDWGKAQLSLDGVSLNADLKARLTRYVRFLAWAGLVTGPTGVGSVMRSAPDAHKLSVAWMFNVEANKSRGNTLYKAENRQKLVATVTASGGSDADGNTWLGPTTVEGLKAKKDDDAALLEYIKTTAAPEAAKVQTQKAIAAEGYKTADKRHPNVLAGTSVSNHLLGEAVDMYPPFVFNNKFDPMIDAIAMYFGLWRAVKDNSSSPEHWHYERLGMPPGSEADAEH
jgi:hypothetical protein